MKNSQIIQILDLPLSQSKEMIPPKNPRSTWSFIECSTHHSIGDSYGCTEWRELTAQIAQVIGSEQGDVLHKSVTALFGSLVFSLAVLCTNAHLICVPLHTWFVGFSTSMSHWNGENSYNSIHFWLTGMNIFPNCSVIKVIKNSCPLSSVTLASTEEVNEFPLNDFKL